MGIHHILELKLVNHLQPQRKETSSEMRKRVKNDTLGQPCDLSAKYAICNIFFTCTSIFWAFFHGSGYGFFRSDPDFLPIRIRTQEKKVRSGSGQKDPDPKNCFFLTN